MRNIVLYLAMSLDGYIADQNGGVGWLEDQTADGQNMGSYPAFIQTVDSVIMGHTTYRQITTELFAGSWPYAEMQSYVLTHHNVKDQDGVQFVNRDVEEFIGEIKQKAGKDIWICGGADLVRQLVQKNLIDRYWITVIPTVLGGGIRLFGGEHEEVKLKLIATETYNGLVDLVYERRASP